VKTPTPRQALCLRAIYRHLVAAEEYPSLRELAAALGSSHPALLSNPKTGFLALLARDGWLEAPGGSFKHYSLAGLAMQPVPDDSEEAVRLARILRGVHGSLTPRQSLVVRALFGLVVSLGRYPTLDELARACGMAGRTGALAQVRAIAGKGVLRLEGKGRTARMRLAGLRLVPTFLENAQGRRLRELLEEQADA